MQDFTQFHEECERGARLNELADFFSSTAVSPRARPGATVSMPLTWSQVKTDLDPKRFTIRTVPALLQKTSAWQDYWDGQRSLEQAIKRLAKSMKQAA